MGNEQNAELEGLNSRCRMVFDSCQCQMVKAPTASQSKQNQQSRTLTWTKFNQLQIGRCRCFKCDIDYPRRHECQSDKTREIEKQNHELPLPFMPASLKANGEPSYCDKYCLDYCEVKRNVVANAFETAESILSLGAVVSLT